MGSDDYPPGADLDGRTVINAQMLAEMKSKKLLDDILKVLNEYNYLKDAVRELFNQPSVAWIVNEYGRELDENLDEDARQLAEPIRKILKIIGDDK